MYILQFHLVSLEAQTKNIHFTCVKFAKKMLGFSIIPAIWGTKITVLKPNHLFL